MIDTRPTAVAAECAREWPSWTKLFWDPDSVGRRFFGSLTFPIEEVRQQLLLWHATSNPWSGAQAVKEIMNGTYEYPFPPEFLGKIFYVRVDNEYIQDVYATVNGKRKKILYFSDTQLAMHYLRCKDSTTPQPFCFMFHGPTYPDNPYDLAIVTLERYDSVEVSYATNNRHPADYLVTYDGSSFTLSHLWNQLDEWGYVVGVERIVDEHDLLYSRRLNDVFARIANATGYGINNGVSREFGIMTNRGHFRLPVVQEGKRYDLLGDPVRSNERFEQFPRIFDIAKYNEIFPVRNTPIQIILTPDEYYASHAVIKMTPGADTCSFTVSTIPDHIYCFASCGAPWLTSEFSYHAYPANGFDVNGHPIYDPNKVTVEWKRVGSLDSTEYTPVIYVVLEYLNQVSTTMPDLMPVSTIIVTKANDCTLEVPVAGGYLLQALNGRTFAVNEDKYKQYHFAGFYGPADYTTEMKKHFLGTRPEEVIPGIDPTWYNRNEAFTDVTLMGLNLLTHEQIAREINDRTRVMWGKFRWGEAFWWELSALKDPTTEVVPTPSPENCLEFVPHFWDTGFAQGRVL